MSWVQEEWKSGLSSGVLGKISELEDSLEKLAKEKKCLQFQADSLQASLDKAKFLEEEVKKERINAEKSVGDLAANLDDKSCQLEKIKATVKEKEYAILNLSNELSNAKKEKDNEKEVRLKLERECEEIQDDLEETKSRLGALNKQLRENKEATPVIIEQHESTKKDLEACKIENCRLNEEILKIKEERDLERTERLNLDSKLVEFEKVDAGKKIEELEGKLTNKNEKIQELESKLHQLKELNIGSLELEEKIRELEEENKTLLVEIDEGKNMKKLCGKDADKLRENLEDVAKELGGTAKERDDVMERLREEREMFMSAETKMKSEMEDVRKEMEMYKLQLQEEREMAMKEEERFKKEIEQLKEEMEDGAKERKKNGEEDEMNGLRKEIERLREEKTGLLEEISRKQEHCSDVEETMKEDINSIKSCLQADIDKLEKSNSELVGKLKEEKDLRKQLQKQLEDLNNELDELSDVLCKERELRKRMEEEIVEMRKEEEYRMKFESLENKDSHYEEKGSLSKLVKKRSDRWNVEVYELKKKIEELEKINRELTINLDKKKSSVGSLRQEFENKFKETSADRGMATSTTATPEHAQRSLCNTPVKKFSARRLNVSLDVNTPDSRQHNIQNENEMIEKLSRDLSLSKDERNKDKRKYEMNLSVTQNEVMLMKQQIKEKDVMIKSMADKLARQNVDSPSKKVNQLKTLDGSMQKDSGVEMRGVSAGGIKAAGSAEELKDLVNEFERESSELQEIIDESKDAIFELTKALQGNEEVFIVDSKNGNNNSNNNNVRVNMVENELLCNAPATIMMNDDEVEKGRPDLASSGRSYILSRLSLADVNFGSVIGKLRIAVSQLESRLDRCQLEKKMMQDKIHQIREDNHGGMDEKRRYHKKMMKKKVVTGGGVEPYDEEEAACVESRSSRSAVMEMARKRDATIIDGTIDDLAHEENIQQQQQQRDENIFKHGKRCRLLWQQLCEARASLSGYEREVNKQKMIYNKHMAECQSECQANEYQSECERVGEKKKTEELQRNMEEIGLLAKEQYAKQEYVVADLEKRLVKEKKSCEMWQMQVDKSMTQLEEEQRKNIELNEKLEECQTILHDKHSRSNEKKLDAIMEYMKNELGGQLRWIKEEDGRRRRSSAKSSPMDKHHGRSNSSRNTSFQSQAEANIEAEIAAKKSSRGLHRGGGGKRMLEEQAYRNTVHGYKTIDELEVMKNNMSGVQDQVKVLLGTIDQLQREKSKLQEERARLVDRIYAKEEDVRRAESRVEAEKRKVKENDVEYRAEMDALRVEQLEVYNQFHEVCSTVKRKDIELLNKTKQIKLLTAEWKEAEMKLENQLESLKNENKTLWAENGELRSELEKTKSQVEDFVRKMSNAEEHLSELYQKLSNLDNMFYECKQKALYQ
eukprot:gene6082-6785_t